MPSETESATPSGSTRSNRTARDLRPRDRARSEVRSLPGSIALGELAEPSRRPLPDPASLSTLNVAVALLLFLLCAPLMALVAVLVRLTSRGPVMFAQERVGLDRRAGSWNGGRRQPVDLGGKPVRIYKFRTMYVDGGPGDQVWTTPGDVRVTRLGRILRAYRIDELPQLFNVFKREMNVVGPRPEQPAIFARLREQYEHFPERQRVLPGITGLSQVKCGYGGDYFQMRRKLAYDLEYVERRGVRQDLEILLRTIPVILTRRGAR